MPPNHWFERHVCGTNGAVAQLCQNSPQKSCCVVVRDYWTGHLYMHIQQRGWYPSRLLWPFALKTGLYCLVCNPHRPSFRASSVEAEVWWGEREGEGREGKIKREFFTQHTRRVTALSKRRPCLTTVFWFEEPELKGHSSFDLSSNTFCHWLQSNFCHQTSTSLWRAHSTVVRFIKPHHSELAGGGGKWVPWFLYPS